MNIQKEYAEELKKLGGLKTEIDPWVLGEMNRIIDSPELYAYEESLSELKEEAEKTHEQWLEIRNSKEFRKGIKLKQILHM